MKSVTILGRGDDWNESEPKTDELWGTVTCLLVNELKDKPFTKVFAFDGEVVVYPEGEDYQIRDALKIARERNIPIVSHHSYADIQFPTRDIVREFKTAVLSKTIAYMMAYAIHLQFERIFIYGIGGRKRWDYEQGRPPIMLWLGIALGRNIDVRIGQGSSRWLYDFSNDLPQQTMQEKRDWHK